MAVNPALFVPGLAPLALAGVVEELLHAIHVDEAVIRKTVAFLTETADTIETMKIDPMSESTFGGSWSGESLGHHTSLAHAHVLKSLQDMVMTLTGASENVKKYHDDMTFVDTDSEQQVKSTLDRYGLSPVASPPPRHRDPQSPHAPIRPTQEPS